MTWLSASQLAASGLPNIPTTAPRASNMIARIALATPDLTRERAGRGGGLEVHLSALPEAAQRELARRLAAEAAKAGAPVPVSTRQTLSRDASHLTARARGVMEARLAVCGYVTELSVRSGRSRAAAIDDLLEDHKRELLDADMARLVAAANARGRGLSRATIYNWFAAARDGVAAVAPRKTRQKASRPDWLDDFLTHFARPTKPDIAEAYRDWAKALGGDPPASYAAVRRALKGLHHVEAARGREGALALRARQAYVVRDFADLAPTTIYIGDGTTFDSEFEHPIHGRPFKPEITTIKDVATRRVVGWSGGLAESHSVVADALRRAAGVGIPALFYSDRGPGYRNARMDDDLTGLLARLGTTPMRALPRNAQARGVIENHQKRWIAVAKKFPTYTGHGMDREAKQKAFLTTRREIAQFGASRLLPTWQEFCDAIDAAIADYNGRPNRALPRFRDPVTGSKRHMSPNELWAEKVAQGCEIIVPDADEMADLFRPHEVRRVRRCMLTLGSNSYFALELDRWHERDVMVGYDPRDAERVWVREIDRVDGERRPGALICVAQFEGNKTRYVPVSMEQAALEKRAEGRRRRLGVKLASVEAELSPSRVLTLHAAPLVALPDSTPASVPMDAVSADGPSTSPLAPQPLTSDGPPAEGGRRALSTDEAWAAWILKHPSEATAVDRELCAELLASEASRWLLRRAGIDLERLAALLLDDVA